MILEDGQQYHGDVLVGADGIWSNVNSLLIFEPSPMYALFNFIIILFSFFYQVRMKLFGRQEAKYSNYTCYSGITKLVPPYIDSVGYITCYMVHTS